MSLKEADVVKLYHHLERIQLSLYDSCGYELKEEQEQVICNILNGKNVFAVLPTGYGKTMCYTVLPIMFNKVCIIFGGFYK